MTHVVVAIRCVLTEQRRGGVDRLGRGSAVHPRVIRTNRHSRRRGV